MEAKETQQLLLQHVRQLGAEVAELKRKGDTPLTDNFAHWLAAQLLVAAKTAASEAEGGCLDLKTLHGLNADVVALRHGDHCAERLAVEREWLDLEIKRFQLQSRTKLDVGLGALADELKKNPEALGIYYDLKEQLAKDASKTSENPFNLQTERGVSKEALGQMEEACYCKPLTPEQKEARMRSVFGLAAQPQNGSSPPPESGPIQPNPGESDL